MGKEIRRLRSDAHANAVSVRFLDDLQELRLAQVDVRDDGLVHPLLPRAPAPGPRGLRGAAAHRLSGCSETTPAKAYSMPPREKPSASRSRSSSGPLADEDDPAASAGGVEERGRQRLVARPEEPDAEVALRTTAVGISPKVLKSCPVPTANARVEKGHQDERRRARGSSPRAAHGAHRGPAARRRGR